MSEDEYAMLILCLAPVWVPLGAIGVGMTIGVIDWLVKQLERLDRKD